MRYERKAAMKESEHRERVVLIYFLLLIAFVIYRMMSEITIIDVIYLIALVCAVIKYFMIVHEARK